MDTAKMEVEVMKPAARPVSVGDKVSLVFDGEVVGYDQEMGKWEIRGNTRGAQHIDWTVSAHWATEFYEWDGEKRVR